MTTPGGQLTPGDDTTPPVYGVPDGAYVGDASDPNAVQQLSHMTEESAKAAMRGTVAPSFAAQRDGIWGIIGDFLAVLRGEYSGSYPGFIDGQTALNERIDLLGTSGYFPATMGSNFRLGPGRNRAMPFDTRIGPNNGAELVQVTRAHPGEGSAVRTEWAIRLDRKGLWQANANFKHLGDPMFGSYGEIVVLRPDLTVYSVTQLPSADPGNTGNNPMGGASLSLFKMFVIPEPGYYVQVRWYWNEWFGIRTAQGGSILSQFAVTQWSDEIDGNEHQNPDGDITDPGGSEPPAP